MEIAAICISIQVLMLALLLDWRLKTILKRLDQLSKEDTP